MLYNNIKLCNKCYFIYLLVALRLKIKEVNMFCNQNSQKYCWIIKFMVKLKLGGNMLIRIEDAKWVNHIGVYFFILNDVNKKLVELIKYANNDIENKELINDGILKLKKYFDFLDQDYKNLFKNYKEELIKINDVRNKLEHCPHQIKWKSYIGNNTEKTIIFNNEEYLMDIIEGNHDKLKNRKDNKEFLEWEIKTNYKHLH